MTGIWGLENAYTLLVRLKLINALKSDSGVTSIGKTCLPSHPAVCLAGRHPRAGILKVRPKLLGIFEVLPGDLQGQKYFQNNTKMSFVFSAVLTVAPVV